MKENPSGSALHPVIWERVVEPLVQETQSVLFTEHCGAVGSELVKVTTCEPFTVDPVVGAVTESEGAVVSMLKVSEDSLPGGVVLEFESVARTYMVWDPLERAALTVQVKASVAPSKVPSLGVQAFQVPAVLSIWYSTDTRALPTSVTDPVSAGVESLFGSGVSAVSVMVGAASL